jgi:hypothetical protein
VAELAVAAIGTICPRRPKTCPRRATRMLRTTMAWKDTSQTTMAWTAMTTWTT